MLAGAMLLADCRRHSSAPAAGSRPGGAPALVPVDLAQVIGRLPRVPRFAAGALAAEPAREFAPAPPPECRLVAPVRTIEIGEALPRVFATAASEHFALLAIAADNDAASWIAPHTGPGPLRYLRGPVEPGSAQLVAAGTPRRDTLVLAWSQPGSESQSAGAVRAAWVAPASASAVLRGLAEVLDPEVSDVACSQLDCVLAYGWSDPYAPPETARRAGFARLGLRPPATLVAAGSTLEGPRPANALVSAPGEAAGTAMTPPPPAGAAPARPHTLLAARVPRDLGEGVLDVARVGTTLRALVARAPTAASCQPGAWQLLLYTVGPDGALANPVEIATIDARPRGARIRAVGASPEPLVTWLDAPQCAPRFFVVRAYRGGHVVAVATGEEYDVAVANGEVWLAVRRTGTLRWIHARCP